MENAPAGEKKGGDWPLLLMFVVSVVILILFAVDCVSLDSLGKKLNGLLHEVQTLALPTRLTALEIVPTAQAALDMKMATFAPLSTDVSSLKSQVGEHEGQLVSIIAESLPTVVAGLARTPPPPPTAEIPILQPQVFVGWETRLQVIAEGALEVQWLVLGNSDNDVKPDPANIQCASWMPDSPGWVGIIAIVRTRSGTAIASQRLKVLPASPDQPTPTPVVEGELCLSVYVDANGNGKRDEGEQWVEDYEAQVYDSKNKPMTFKPASMKADKGRWCWRGDVGEYTVSLLQHARFLLPLERIPVELKAGTPEEHLVPAHEPPPTWPAIPAPAANSTVRIRITGIDQDGLECSKLLFYRDEEKTPVVEVPLKDRAAELTSGGQITVGCDGATWLKFEGSNDKPVEQRCPWKDWWLKDYDPNRIPVKSDIELAFMPKKPTARPWTDCGGRRCPR